MRQPVQVAVFAVRRAAMGWEFLNLHRTPATGGFWQPVTGGVEDDEPIPDTARRELKEETGFEPSRLEPIDGTRSFPVPENMKHHYSPDVTELIEHTFLAIVAADKAPTIDPAEHDDWKWCSADAAEELFYWPGNIKALRQCELVLKEIV